MTVFIYGLWDPRDGRLRYIGKTVNLKQRFHRHLVDYDRGKITHCSTWVKGILNENLRPLLEVLEETTDELWQAVERDWIAQAQKLGLELVNMVPGGSGGAVKGRIVSTETRRRLSESRKGKSIGPIGPMPEEQKQKIGRANRGHRPRLGMKNSPEHNEKIGRANAQALAGRGIPEPVRLKGLEARWSKPGERERWAEVAGQRKRGPDGRFLPQEAEP